MRCPEAPSAATAARPAAYRGRAFVPWALQRAVPFFIAVNGHEQTAAARR